MREMLPELHKLSILNRHHKYLQGPEYLHHLVRKAPATGGPAIDFLEHGGKRQELTYDVLHTASDALANRIKAYLARLEHTSAVIPVLLPQSPALYIALLAILKAGRAFCPIGLDWPLERVGFILGDISADVIITDTAHKDALPTSMTIQTLLVDRNGSEHGHIAEGAIRQREQTRLAYVLYTSGSTGLPKAVSVSHRAVTQSLLAHDRHIPPFARFLQFAAPTFDVSIFEIFFPLYRGCTLVGSARAQMLNDLPGTISSLGVDAAELTPTVVSNLLRGRKSVPGLKLLLTIGEMLTRDVVDEFGGTESRSSLLWAMYGPTEAAIHCTLYPSLSCGSSLGNIGFPLDTVTTLIAAPVTQENSTHHVELLPFGEIGELVIGGHQVADEYLNRPELTVKSFFHHQEFGYLYRTGDKARLRPDGTLECLGRITAGQVKLRGQRVELGEIEQAIFKIDNCRGAVAMIIEDALVAFCATGSSAFSRTTVEDVCRQWLPGYMVPTEIILLQHMPQLSSGKVDKKALEAQYLTLRRQHSSSDLQSNHDSDESFVSVFRTNFGRHISYEEDFGNIGLDSLRSIRIASALREQGYNIGAIDILATKNLGDLMTVCKGRKKSHKSVPTDVCVDGNLTKTIVELHNCRNDIADILHCTPLQEAMLAETVARPSAYCNWIEVELSKSLTFSQICNLVGVLAQHNEILRSGFCVPDIPTGTFVQVVWKQLPPAAVIEVSAFSREYSLGSMQSLLRPLTVQVITATKTPRLLFQIHHALYDGWSFDLILRDFDDLMHGRSIVPRSQFREVVGYYLEKANSKEFAKSEAYWRDVIHDYHPTTLPNFNGMKVRQTGLRSACGESIVDPNSLYASAKEFAVHPQVFYQAAIAQVLSQYLGVYDTVIGTVTSGRTIPVNHVEDIVGPCIASLPFRVDFSDCFTVADLLRKTQETNRDMLEHCVLPLRDITRICQLRPGERLFDVLFIWQQSIVSVENRKLALRMVDSADDLEFKITFEIELRDDKIGYRITYDHSTIPEQQIKYLMQQVDQTVQYFLSSYDGKLTEARKFLDSQLLSIANPTPTQKPFHHGPSHSVERWAVETPDKDAVIIGSITAGNMTIRDRLTYGSLNACANQLAHALVEMGTKQDQLVCILLEKSINLYISILAVLKIGCGYLPIVPDTPTERINHILADAEVSICISNLESSTNIRRGQSIVLDIEGLDFAHYSDQDLGIPYDGSHLAYAVFTSGSTGKPKGVLVTQHNLMSNLEHLSSLYPVTGNSRLLQACSQAFDVSVFEIFFSWHVGICLCTASKDDLFYDFEAAINSLNITHLSLTPTVAGLVDPNRVPKVNFLVTAGEALSEGVRRKWAGRGLYQGYGPSETTNICTVKPCVTDSDLINNIGPAFPNTSVLVLAEGSDTIVPRGAVGELCFGGAQVFRGYLNRPDLNAQKIINHPKHGRIYRSGDMGRLLPDDSILFSGRLDDQVKIRGQRVELGEITSIVLDHPLIHDCTTALLDYGPERQKLVAFWVPKTALSTEFYSLAVERYRSTILDVFDALSLQLPTYMIPTRVIPISSIPMTPQAKVDKRLLRDTFESLAKETLELASSGLETEREDNVLSAQEKQLAEILSRTLGLPLINIGRNSSFFNLGLDSVSAIHFTKGLRDAGFNHVPVSVVLKNPTLERLSSAIVEPNVNSASLADSAVLDLFSRSQLSQIRSQFRDYGASIQKVLPCTPLQEAMLSSSSKETSYYNMMAFAVNGNLHRLKECCEYMVKRHDILRTTFVSTNNPQYAFAQVVLEHKPISWDYLSSSTDITTYAGKVLSDLLESRKPPMQLAIQEIGTMTRLLFCCHHALYDGIAIATLLGEIEDQYTEKELPPPVPYEVYLRHMVSQDLGDARSFWSTTLLNFEPGRFPNLSSKKIESKKKEASVHRLLRVPLSESLEYCQTRSISLLSIVQAAWAKLLRYVSGDTDLCFGNVFSGRTLPEDGLDRLVAPCFNTLPIRVNFNFEKSNSELCTKLHSFNLDVLPFQLTPLRWIQSKTRKEQGSLFDTLVILQQSTTPLNNRIWSLEHDTGEMDVPIVCEVSQDKSKDALALNLHYQSNMCEKHDAEILAQILDSAFQSLIRFPHCPAEDTIGFPNHLLSQSNMEVRAFDHTEAGLLHSEFEKNAAERPDAVALEFRHVSGLKTVLTFGALNERANQIAHALIQLEVQTEDVVPVHIPKSPEYYASILGVLKAGAAFSPIHPELPSARKQLMLTELQPKAVLSLEDVLNWFDGPAILNVNRTVDHPTHNSYAQAPRPTSMAYCLYTSGSTGVPKPVSMEHRSPVQTIESSRPLIPWNRDSRLLQYAATTFDMCYYDCFVAWTFGFALCAADQEAMLNNLTETINALNVDLLDLTPAVATSLRRVDIPNVKWLYCIGEAMTPEVVKEWDGICVNSYGPTEAAFCTTIFSATKETKTSIIGQPFPTTSFAVFPYQGQRPMPVFGVGELYIGGAQLARGYYNQKQLTEEKFLHRCGQRFYKSGDMVRMLSDGNFEFLGRTDDQVKIRGLRVELGEINNVLLDSNENIVTVSTQILRKELTAKDQLVAFIVPNRSFEEDEQSKLRLQLKQTAVKSLPSYMVPQFFLFTEKIPKSMAGKVDKKALAAIFRGSAEINLESDNAEDTASNHHWTECQGIIRKIFSEFSGTPQEDIKPQTTIYQLGLDSISAVQIAAALRKYGLQVNAADVMKYMDCRDLAAYLERVPKPLPVKAGVFDFSAFERKHRAEVLETCGVSQEWIEAIRPCTPLQNGMLSQFVAQEGGMYFNYLRLRLGKDINLDRLRKAWLATIQNHRMLRTGFNHVKSDKTSFAMIHYSSNVQSLGWQDTAMRSTTVDDWLQESKREVARHLHQPPWRLRIVEEDGATYLDLALLHAIFDAQSLRIVFSNVAASYNNTTIANSVPLEPLIAGIFQSNSENTASVEFWKRLGKEAIGPTRFPNLSPLRYDPTAPLVLSRSSSRTMEELDMGCRRSNINLQAAGLASWATILSAYTGEPSVTFGVVLSGRNIDGAEVAVFPCITTVPFVCKVSDDKDEVLKGVMSLNAELQQHQFTPLNEIQRLMGYPHEPLFDSIFAFQKLATDDNHYDLWKVEDERATTEYPLSIELEPEHGRLELRLTFLPHVVPTEQAALILKQLDYLLDRYVFSNTNLGTVDQQLYSITPPKEPTISSEVKLLHDFVELSAIKYPNRIAFEFATSLRHDAYASRLWTYAELDNEGNRLAHVLISQGVRPGELVGVCFDKSPEASFALLGILKAGCAFVALDPGAPSARKAFILKDSGSRVVFSMKAQSTNMKENISATILNLDEVDWRSMSSRKPSLERNIDPQDRSYCLYTSGTTGTPKGCEITHENAVQAMMAFRRLFSGHWDDDSRWLQFASFHFDVSVLEQFWSWSVGICVVSAPRDLIFEDLASSIRMLGITHIDLTPSLARILHPDDTPTLCKGVFITGGESLKQEILDVWGPKSVIYNGYGPTEATIGVTMYPRVPANGKPSNIGPQFDNVGTYVLRPGSGVPVLRGGVGELCVSGKLVGRGYLNRPSLTEERFAHLDRFDERVYRTGDLVRILHDGTFDFLGRADDQVKLRGQRLEIGEINSVIKQCGITVADVATLVLRHPKQQKEQLVSFVVTGSGTRGEAKVVLQKTGDLREAKRSCQEKLPPYMVPTYFVALTSMPLSINNKADARKLKEIYEALSVNELQLLASGTQATDEKWTKQEERVRDTLKEELNIAVENFSKDASLFELGMDSISVISVSRALRQAGFSKGAASVILQNATVRRLAKALSDQSTASIDNGSIIAAQQAIAAIQHRHRRSVAETLFMDARNVEALAPCTPLQQGMIARSLDSDHGLYFNAFYLEVRSDVGIDRLRDAWDHTFASTPILRTVFVNTDDGFVQAILRNVQLHFAYFTLPESDNLEDHLGEKKDRWVRINRTHIKRPFEISVVEKSHSKLLVVHIFHGLYDGNSINLIFKSVWNAYNGRRIGKDPSFHSTLAYGPLRPVANALKFWENHLGHRDFRPFVTYSDTFIKKPIIVSRELLNLNIDTTRRKLNVTAQAIAQACWAVVLHQRIKTTVTIGMVVSGRSIDFEGAEKVIGPLFNTIPYQYRAQQRETWVSVITRAHDFNVAAHPYQHTPLRDIMKLVKRGPNQPLFDTLFAYQVVEEDDEWARNDLWELRDSGAQADYPLAIEVEQASGGTINLTLVAQGGVLNTETSGQLLDFYVEALRQALDTPDAVLETFDAEGKEPVQDIFDDERADEPSLLKDTSDFNWTSHASTIRNEIATLSGVNIEDVSADVSIFELGLDSIDVIKLSSKLKKHGLDLPVSGIMRSLNIINMLQHMSIADKKRNDRPSDMIYRANKKQLENYLRRHGLADGVEQVLPLTPLQEAMVAEMIVSEYKRYYNHDVLKLRPGVEVERLKKAWTEVVAKSPVLRTSFIQVDVPGIDSSYAQIIQHEPHNFWSSTLLEHEPDFPQLFESIRMEAFGNHLTEPLFHVRLIQSFQQAYLVLSIAHALYDGWSLSLIHSDIQQAYMGSFQSRPSYESTLHEILTTSGPDAAAFWRDYLSNAQSTPFPRRINRSKETNQLVHRKRRDSCLSLSVVRSFAKRHNITLQTLGQAVHGMTVASYTKSLDVTFGSVLSGRDDESRSKLLFPTMNTVAIRTILYGSLREMLQYVQENFLNIKQWQHFPLRKAMSLARLQGTLIESLFIYQKTLSSRTKEGEKLYESIQSRSDVEYPVCVEMEVVGEALVWRCAVKEEVFDNAGAEELLERLDGVLKAIVDQPDAPVINFTADGTSICGLPTFTDKRTDITNEEHAEGKQQEAVHSKSPTAKVIREVLAFVSKTPEEEITADMTIFHIGLDSISAIKVASLLRKRGVIISVGEMLRAGGVDGMARLVDERAPDAGDENENIGDVLQEALSGIDRASVLNEANIRDDDVEHVLPATAGQTYMLSMWLNSKGAVFYPEFKCQVHGPVTFETLQEAWKTILVRHSILRTRFCVTKDERTPYIQAIMRHTICSILDVTGWDNERVSDRTAKVVSEQPYAHVSASQSPSGWDITLKIHHALYDGVSLPLLMQQLQALCNTVDIPSTADTLSKVIAITSSTFAAQQRKAFWTNYLRSVEQHRLVPPDAAPGSRIEIFQHGLLSDVSDLESQAHKHGLTTQSLFLAVYAKLYARITSTGPDNDVIIGVYLANRSFPVSGVHQAAIPTVNLVPLRVSAPLETDIFDTATQIQYDLQEVSAPANASASLWEIYEWTGIKLDTFVNFLKLPDAEKDGSAAGDSAVRILHAEQRREESSRITKVGNRGVAPPKELVDQRVNGAYLHALDVEATIRNGALDVGVFVPEEMMSLEGGERLVEGIRVELVGLRKVVG